MDLKLFKTLTAFALLLLGVYLLGVMLLPFLSALAWAVIIGIITFPLYRQLRRFFKTGAGVSSALMTMLVMLVFVLPGIALLTVLAKEVAALYRLVESSISSGETVALLQRFTNNHWFTWFMDKVRFTTGMTEADLLEKMMADSQQFLGRLLKLLTSLLTNSAAFVLDMLFMLFILFFVFRDGASVKDWLIHNLTPQGHRYGRLIPQVIQDVLTAFIFGTLLTSLLQGLLAGLAYWIAGVPSPFLLGLLTGIGGFIPVIGTAIIWLPAAIYLFWQGSTTSAILLSLWGLLVVGMADNVVRPLFMSSKVSLPILPLMLGALGGFAAFGVLGAIFGPLLLAILYELFVNNQQNSEQQETVEPIMEGGETK
ncbi:MAG: AI-2E family transporter [Trichlorobacter sp.]|nr:AI-2E family transporter [Trichlorobacter sp.]